MSLQVCYIEMCGIKSMHTVSGVGAAIQYPQDTGPRSDLRNQDIPDFQFWVNGGHVTDSPMFLGREQMPLEASGQEFLHLRGNIHNSDLRRSPCLCRGVCITRENHRKGRDVPWRLAPPITQDAWPLSVEGTIIFLLDWKTKVSKLSPELTSLGLLIKYPVEMLGSNIIA